MEPNKKIALDITKEIVVARMGNSQIRADKSGGSDVAAFFEEIYNRVLTIANRVD